MTRYWIGVASKEHVQKGILGGFAQVCHGKAGPLNRMRKGDWIVYYSPTLKFGGKEPCQSFTAIGEIMDGDPYPVAMSENFIPWRRDVAFVQSQEVSIRKLLNHLSFIKDKQKWGFPFRRGCFEISQEDFQVISQAMGVYQSVNFKEISVHETPDHSLGFLLWHISTAWRGSIEKTLKPMGLTHPQFVILAALGWLTKKGGRVTQAAIGKMAGLDPNTVSQIIRGLEKKELITREKSSDKRAKNPILTMKGTNALKLALPAVEKEDNLFFHHLTAKETECIIRIFRKLAPNREGVE